MESTFNELEVITHSEFFINAQSVFKNPKICFYLEDLIFNSKTIFKKLDGGNMNNNDVLRMVTFLSQSVDEIPKEPLSDPPEEFNELYCKTKNPLFLTEFSKINNDLFSSKLGYYFFNADSFIDGINKALLYTERYKGRRKINITNTTRFKYSELLPYKQTANYFILNDQYFGNLSVAEIEVNLIPLIKNCTTLLDKNYPGNILIITKIKRDFKNGRDNKTLFDANYSLIKINEINNLISNRLPENINYKFIIFKEYLIDIEIRDEKTSYEHKKKIKEIKESLQKLHDRFFISNYLIGEATNSLNFLYSNGNTKVDCDLTLSSTLDVENVKEFKLCQKAIDKCNSYLESEFAKKYFIKYERSGL